MRILALLLVFGLAGCSLAPKPPAGSTEIAPGVTLPLPSPAEFGAPVELVQSIRARYRDQSFAFEAHLALTPDQLTVVALDGFGRRALTMSWQGGQFSVDSALWLPASIDPAHLLADLTLLYAPHAVVQALLAPAGAELVDTAQHRRITRAGVTLIDIAYAPGKGWTGTALYRNLAFGYQLDIQSSLVPDPGEPK